MIITPAACSHPNTRLSIESLVEDRAATFVAEPRHLERRRDEHEHASSHPALPVVSTTGSGHDHPNFKRLKSRDAALLREIARATDDELAAKPMLSVNAKTGVSLDVAISLTCHPTPVCMSVCYAGTPSAAATWTKSRRKRIRNTEIIRRDPLAAAERVVREYVRFAGRFERQFGRRHDFLRINGSGDLFPESVVMVNAIAAAVPELTLWVVSRRLDQAREVARLANVFLQLSLDASSTPAFVREAEALVREHPRAYLSFLRTSPEDDTHCAAIVFNEKRTPGLPFDGVSDCPVDAGRLPLGNPRRGAPGDACARCRRCFSERALVRQRGHRRGERAPHLERRAGRGTAELAGAGGE